VDNKAIVNACIVLALTNQTTDPQCYGGKTMSFYSGMHLLGEERKAKRKRKCIKQKARKRAKQISMGETPR